MFGFVVLFTFLLDFFVFAVSFVILFCGMFLDKSDNMKTSEPVFSSDNSNAFVWTGRMFMFFVPGLCFLFTSPSEFGFRG